MARGTIGIIGLIALLAGACATAPEPAYQILTAFHDDDFAYWKGQGSYAVSGFVAAKQPDGAAVSCAGQTVRLMPLTAYNMELAKLLETGKGVPPNYERRARKYERTAECGADGKFVFTGVPSANWLVAVHVGWPSTAIVSTDWIDWFGDDTETPSASGGWLFKEITVHGSDLVVPLKDDDLVADQ